MGIQPTGSRTALLLQCPRPFEESTEIPVEQPNAASLYGDAFHEGMANLVPKMLQGLSISHVEIATLAAGYPACGKPPFVESPRLTADKIQELANHLYRAEMALEKWLKKDNPFGIDFVNGTVFRHVERSYAVPLADWPLDKTREIANADESHTYDSRPTKDRELPMTPDLLLEGKYWSLVVDYKTGRLGDWSRPSQTPQMQSAGLIPTPGKKVYLAVLDADRTAIPTVYSDEMSAAARRSHAKKLRQALGRIGSGFLRQGPACKYCPARHDCPARDADLLAEGHAIVEGMAQGLAVAGKNAALTSVERIGKIYPLLRVYDRLSDRLRKEIKAQVRMLLESKEFVTTTDGKILWISKRKVRRLSLSSIERAVGKAEAARWIERLEKIGAVEVKEEEHLDAIDNEKVGR